MVLLGADCTGTFVKIVSSCIKLYLPMVERLNKIHGNQHLFNIYSTHHQQHQQHHHQRHHIPQKKEQET